MRKGRGVGGGVRDDRDVRDDERNHLVAMSLLYAVLVTRAPRDHLILM